MLTVYDNNADNFSLRILHREKSISGARFAKTKLPEDFDGTCKIIRVGDRHVLCVLPDLMQAEMAAVQAIHRDLCGDSLEIISASDEEPLTYTYWDDWISELMCGFNSLV